MLTINNKKHTQVLLLLSLLLLLFIIIIIIIFFNFFFFIYFFLLLLPKAIKIDYLEVVWASASVRVHILLERKNNAVSYIQYSYS